MKQVHLNKNANQQFKSGKCDCEDLSLLNVKEPIRKMRNNKNLQWNSCNHDLSVFSDKASFVDHVMRNHGHSVWENDRGNKKNASVETQSADGRYQ